MGSPSVNNYSAGRRAPLLDRRARGADSALAADRPLVGHQEWLEDPRFATPLDRAMNAAELVAVADEAFATKTLDEWAPLFDAEPDMFWARVQDPFEVVNDPTLRDAGGIVDVPDEYGTTPMIATPVDFHGRPWSAARAWPPSRRAHRRGAARRSGR